MADGNIIAAIKNIIKSDPERRFIVVSAPGKRYSDDVKITDLLYECHKQLLTNGSCGEAFAPVARRFRDIVAQLGLDFDIGSVLERTRREIEENASEDFTASRGEYLSALIMAQTLGARFVDAHDVIFFKEDGSLDGDKSYKAVSEAVKGAEYAVFPGFYGRGADGNVKTFSRGGSDISGAIVARAVNASLYENWTDVSGFLACDPRIVEGSERIKSLSYKELRELSYMGANVLHSESIFPVRKANIPINIRNTFRPDDEGTLILPTSRYILAGNTVTGIAGRKNFTVIFIRKVLTVVESEGVPIEHIPSGIDTMSLVIESDALAGNKLERIINGIKSAVEPDVIRVIEDIALIATVGHGMSSSVGTSARLFNAIAAADVNIKMIDQGSSELNIVVGVSNEDYERCIKAIYAEFFKKRV